MKVILFDIGGVIENHEEQAFNIEKVIIDFVKKFNNNLSDKEILDMWTWSIDGSLNGKTLGVTNDEKDYIIWIETIKQRFNFECSIDKFLKEYYASANNMKLYKGVQDLINELLSLNVKVGLFSDTVFLVKDRIKREVPYDRMIKFFSFEIGMKKNNIESYKYVINKLNVNPGDILFLDDKMVNIELARKCGIKAIKFENDKILFVKQSIFKFLNN